MKNKKLRVLILAGVYEKGVYPVPPVADGAPEWNIFRLAEAAFSSPDSSLEIHVVSLSTDAQLEALKNFPARATDRYHHLVFKRALMDWYRKYLLYSLPLHLFLRHVVNLPDFVTWAYLSSAVNLIQKLQPDIVIINDRPQYIDYLRKKLTTAKLLLMIRYPVGDSRRFLARLDGIIVNSKGMQDYVAQFVASGSPPIWQIPNTLGDEFNPLGAVPDRFFRADRVILFVGRPIPEKGALEVLQAFKIVAQSMPDARLIMCGMTGFTPYEQKIRTLAAEFPVGAVELVGHVPNRQLAAQYLKAYVAVFPSLREIYIESFGMVALEAMRCGTPVVASRQPGFEELIREGETGLLVDDPRDTPTLAAAILTILQDSALAQQMGLAGYQCSLAYTPQSGLAALEEIIKNLVFS